MGIIETLVKAKLIVYLVIAAAFIGAFIFIVYPLFQTGPIGIQMEKSSVNAGESITVKVELFNNKQVVVNDVQTFVTTADPSLKLSAPTPSSVTIGKQEKRFVFFIVNTSKDTPLGDYYIDVSVPTLDAQARALIQVK